MTEKAANVDFSENSVTGTLSLDGDLADTPPSADETFQLLYAAPPTMGGAGNTSGGGRGGADDDLDRQGGDAGEGEPRRGDASASNGMLVALRHPLRRKILQTMIELEPISPRQISKHLRTPLSNVSYHVRVLSDCGAVTLVGTTPVRGSMQHFYATKIDEPWARAVLGMSEKDEPAPGDETEGPAT
jgi:DNA-binding transcriptional ArsR family regulator